MLDEIREEWLFHPESDRAWAPGYESAGLLEFDEHGDTVVASEIHRRPNRDWLGTIQNGAVARDGSLALIAAGHGFSGGKPEVCV
ncbi:MAG: hypothetical protein AAFX79_00240 [Planctomycetota bacterium]